MGIENVVDSIINQTVSRVMRLGYIIKDAPADYTTTADDYTGRTVIRGTMNGNQVITITNPGDDFIGKTLNIRKAAGELGTTLTIATNDVTINADDITPLRRLGSSVSLVYVGNGVWDAYGELP